MEKQAETTPGQTEGTSKSELYFSGYQPGLKGYFEALNKAWITQYFKLEPIDQAVLEDPETHILQPGGTILFALTDGTVVGTVALKKVDGNTFEFTKMAVAEDRRGQKIGWHLSLKALERAKELGASKVILYSNTVLQPAISLYRKLGFTEVQQCSNLYERCNIMMEIDIT